jgi:hypothetical protein
LAGTAGSILYADNIDFSGGYPVEGEITLNGELFVGSAIAPNIRPYIPTGTNGLVVNTGPGTIDFTLAAIPNSALQNSSVNIIAGTGLTGGGNVSLGGSVTLNASGGGTVTSVSGTANQVAVATGTTTPVISLIGPYTPATYTTHGVLIGEATSSIVALAAGTAGQVLQSGGASADPAYSTATYPATAGTSGNVLTSNGTNWNSSAAPAGNMLQTAAITLTNTQLKALNTTPISVISAPGAGVVIVPMSCTLKLDYGGTNAFSNSPALTLYWGSGGTAILLILAASNTGFSEATSNQYTFAFTGLAGTQTQTATNLENKAVFIQASANYTGNAANNNTIGLVITYYTVTIS